MKHNVELTKEEIFLVRNALIGEKMHLEDMAQYNGRLASDIKECNNLMLFFDSIYRAINE